MIVVRVLAVVLVAVMLFVWLTVDLTERSELAVGDPRDDVEAIRPPTTTTTTSTTTTFVQPTHVRKLPSPVARSAPSERKVVAESTGTPVLAVIRAGFARFGPEVAEEAVRVAKCESGLNPRAANGQHAGLMQISRTYHAARVARLGFTWAQMFEAGPNVAVAADIYRESGGWGPWTCRWAA